MALTELLGKLISYGPCQFPTLGFITERYAAIQSFVPERFWTIQLSYSPPRLNQQVQLQHEAQGGAEDDADEGERDAARGQASIRGRARYSTSGGRGGTSGPGSVTFAWTRGRLYDFLASFVLYESAVNDGVVRVVSVNQHPANRCVISLVMPISYAHFIHVQPSSTTRFQIQTKPHE
jgi:DNA topoisomerase III